MAHATIRNNGILPEKQVTWIRRSLESMAGQWKENVDLVFSIQRTGDVTFAFGNRVPSSVVRRLSDDQSFRSFLERCVAVAQRRLRDT